MRRRQTWGLEVACGRGAESAKARRVCDGKGGLAENEDGMVFLVVALVRVGE